MHRKRAPTAPAKVVFRGDRSVAWATSVIGNVRAVWHIRTLRAIRVYRMVRMHRPVRCGHVLTMLPVVGSGLRVAVVRGADHVTQVDA